MSLRNILNQFNIAKQCRQYNLSLWQCPGFLTIVMGVTTLIVMSGTYLIANHYAEEPEVAALIVIIVTAIIFVIGYLIVNSFNYLAEANRMKSEFVGIVSHQLRTPLSALKWALGLLIKEEALSEEQRKEYLEIVKSSNNRMIKLVNDLLDISRIERGKIDIKPQKFSLAKLAQESVSDLELAARKNNVKIELKNDENLPDVWADPSRIRLVLQNLLDNAVKYSNDNGRVEVKIGREGDNLRCEIIDNGVGISVSQQSQVFQKFFRSDNIKKNQVEGTGLGLFIVKAIIEMSKGKVDFESKEGKGSNFWFTIPIIKF
jgi:signal transduction histidine kinase